MEKKLGALWGQSILLADPRSSGSRRLKGGCSQDWLPHLEKVEILRRVARFLHAQRFGATRFQNAVGRLEIKRAEHAVIARSQIGEAVLTVGIGARELQILDAPMSGRVIGFEIDRSARR